MKILITILFLFNFINQSFTQSVWNFQNSGTTSNLNSIYYKFSWETSEIFVCGNNGVILKSTNNGLIWDMLNSNTTADLYSIEVLDDTGYAVGENGTILITTNDGVSWSQVNSGTTNTLKCIRARENNSIKATIVGTNGIFIKFINGNWLSNQIDTSDLNSISGVGTSMIAVGNGGTILRTTNSGQSWNRIVSRTRNNLNSLHYSYIVGDSGTAFLINGNVVNPINSSTYNNLYSVYNYGFVFACGENGIILKDWVVMPTNNFQKLNSISTFSDFCWAVGDNGTILFSNSIRWTNDRKQLNANNINAWFKNDGSFNYLPSYTGGFEWPRAGNRYARYASGSYVGAIVNGDTLVTVCRYTSEYQPGYTDDNGIPNGNESPEYRNYRMIYGISDSDRIQWPNALLGNSDQGAPVYFDSSTISYKQNDFGNQTMFYSYTDSYAQFHGSPGGMTTPLKADVKQINYSFNQPEELRNIIYQEFRIINRSNSIWTNAFINFWTDDDLGDATDDAEAVDTNLRLAYTYNFDNHDGQYGDNPPAVGFIIIRSPLYYTGNNNDTVFYYEGKNKRIKVGYKESNLNSTIIFLDDSLEPHNYRQSYNTIRGLQNNGVSYINPVTNQITRFVYSGDPVTGTGWNQNGGNDVRFYQGFGPLNMNPGDTQVIVIAQVIARGSSNLNSITKLRETSQTAKEYYDNCFEDVVIGINNITTSIPDNFYLYQNYPNPFNPSTVISYQLAVSNFVSLKVYDAVGKEIATLVNEKQNAGKYTVTFNGSNFSSGIYFYKIETGRFVLTKKMMLLK